MIRGTVQVKVSLEAEKSAVAVTLYVTDSEQMPHGEVLLSWEAMSSLGLFTIPEGPSTQQGSRPTVSVLRKENKDFLDNLAKNPPKRVFQEVAEGDPEYSAKIEKGCEEVLKALLEDYPIAFQDHLTPNTYIDNEPVRVLSKKGLNQ